MQKIKESVHNNPSNFHEFLFGLAPMEGVTDLPVRLWLSLMGGFHFAMTPFLRVTQDYSPKRIPTTFAPEISALRGEVYYTLVPQLMGSDPEDLAPIAKSLLQYCEFVDFNCGCPSPKVVGNGAGSALLESHHVFARFVSSLASHLGTQQFSVKMRLGYSSAEEITDLLQAIVTVLPRRLTIHGRTRAQRYKGKADWNKIFDARGVIDGKAQIIGSGDILSQEGLKFLLDSKTTPIDGYLIGRGALRNPLLMHCLSIGRSVEVSRSWLLTVFRVAAILLQSFESHPVIALSAIGESGCFRVPLANHCEKWQNAESLLLSSLCKFGLLLTFEESMRNRSFFLSPEKPFCNLASAIDISRGTLCKLKMLWNYLRTGLPVSTLDKSVLRTSTFVDFYNAIDGFLKSSVAEHFSFCHQPMHDWIFSGEKALAVGE